MVTPRPTTIIDSPRLSERLGATLILASETLPDAADALVPRLPEYLAAAERLWVFIDEWRAR